MGRETLICGEKDFRGVNTLNFGVNGNALLVGYCFFN